MSRKRASVTGSVTKAHATSFRIEQPVFRAMQDNCGPAKKFKDYNHCANYCIAQVLGVKGEE